MSLILVQENNIQYRLLNIINRYDNSEYGDHDAYKD